MYVIPHCHTLYKPYTLDKLIHCNCTYLHR